MQNNQTYYIGIDFHKKNSYVTAINEEGEIQFQRKVENEERYLKGFLNSLPLNSKIVIEATCNWYYFYETVEDRFPVTLAHPLKTKAIASARIKNDKIDSHILAQLLRAALIPPAYIPSREARDIKEILRYRCCLVFTRTSLKNRVHAILSKNGLNCSYSDVFGKKACKWLLELKLRECYRRELEGYVRLANALNEEITKIEQVIDKEAEKTTEAVLLDTIPGIGKFSALLISAEIGEIARFPSANKLCSYAGLVPSMRVSGDRVKKGSITKQGSRWLRWILVENAYHIINQSFKFRFFYERIKAKHGPNAAKIAVARKVLRIIYYMLRNGEPYREKAIKIIRDGRTPEGHAPL
ncbi:MAG: IS110 family transposase [Candidatus Aminicenantia bacterium]